MVYKIDRLTRSLADFARMVEVFEERNVSFVSVTQAFNTTSSMGRLTLNVLLSFAQFEREVTGERIRDKIAASKKKGMWMGGNVPLGYDRPVPGTRKLRINDKEAKTVTHIFQSYLELGSVYEVEHRLQNEGIRSKQSVSARGNKVGGQPLSRGALFHLLRNRTYLGEIPHRDQSYPGLHDAIIDRGLFNAVQEQLNENSVRRKSTRERVSKSPLTGRIFDADGQIMSPTFAYGKSGKLYRYYVSAALQQGNTRFAKSTTPQRVSASAIEGALTETLGRLLPRIEGNAMGMISRLEVRLEHLVLSLPIASLADIRDALRTDETAEPDPADRTLCRVTLPNRITSGGGPADVVNCITNARKADPVLIKALRTAHAMLGTDKHGDPILDAGPETPHRRKLLRLAFLAPDIQSAILAGTQPSEITLARLIERELPLSWEVQRQLFGFKTKRPSTC